jgi:multidrug efflux pump subunit AcrB
VVLIFTILVMQFNSFRQAIVVMMTVPLSFIGVIAFLWVFHFDFSLAAFIGLVSLTGVVVNDAIVLVDFANQARRRGLTVHDACFEAGMIRARPVVLTMLSTVGNIFPLFLNLSGGAEFWRPLSGSIALGLCFATGLTLIVIPVSYSMIYDPRGRSPKTDWPPKLLPEDQAIVDRLLAERASAAAAVS